MYRRLLFSFVVAVLATTGIGQNLYAQDADSIFFSGVGTGTGGVEVYLSMSYKFSCSISAAQNCSLSLCSPISGQWISQLPTTVPASISTANSTPSRALIQFQYQEVPGITLHYSFFLTEDGSNGCLSFSC